MLTIYELILTNLRTGLASFLAKCPIRLDLIRWDVAEAYQLGFQDVSSSIGEEII
jgi:hypothetical protein